MRHVNHVSILTNNWLGHTESIRTETPGMKLFGAIVCSWGGLECQELQIDLSTHAERCHLHNSGNCEVKDENICVCVCVCVGVGGPFTKTHTHTVGVHVTLCACSKVPVHSLTCCGFRQQSVAAVDPATSARTFASLQTFH